MTPKYNQIIISCICKCLLFKGDVSHTIVNLQILCQEVLREGHFDVNEDFAYRYGCPCLVTTEARESIRTGVTDGC